MADTTFVDGTTTVVAAWLNDVNDATYTTVPAHTATLASGVVLKDSSTGAATLPSGTTAQRPTPATGMFRYNTSFSYWEGYNGVSWAGLSSTDYLNTLRIDVASASTVDLTSLAPNTRNINITGTTTITGFTVAAGQTYIVRFNAALTLTNNAAIVTQTGANIVTDAGATCLIRATAANTIEVLSYTTGAGSVSLAGNQTIAGTKTFSSQPVVPAQSYVAVDTFNLYGSTNTRICRFTNLRISQGTDITYADSATLGATFTINTSGTYAISWNHNIGAAGNFGLSLNSAQLTTNIESITAANRIAMASPSGSNVTTQVTITRPFVATDVIRAHGDATGLSGNPERVNFTITRIA